MKAVYLAASVCLLAVGCGVAPGFPDPYKEKGAVNTPVINGKKIFVTAATTTGNSAGIAGADKLCEDDANKPVGFYRALMVDGNRRVAQLPQTDWVLKPGIRYIRPDGTHIADGDTNGYFVFPLVNPISASAAVIWTGLVTGYVTEDHCSAWSSAAGNGRTGRADSATATAFFSTSAPCTGAYQVVCVQQ